MRIVYNKLVRDRIPEIIREDGKSCGIEVFTAEAFGQALRTKLIEEAKELAEAPQEEIMKELSDIREVLDALMAYYAVSETEATEMQEQRRTERGGFAQHLKLLWTE